MSKNDCRFCSAKSLTKFSVLYDFVVYRRINPFCVQCAFLFYAHIWYMTFQNFSFFIKSHKNFLSLYDNQSVGFRIICHIHLKPIHSYLKQSSSYHQSSAYLIIILYHILIERVYQNYTKSNTRPYILVYVVQINFDWFCVKCLTIKFNCFDNYFDSRENCSLFYLEIYGVIIVTIII